MATGMPAATQSGSGGEAQYSICQLEPQGQETGGFVWTVRNFSKIRDTRVWSEPGCCLGGVSWSLLLFPKGQFNPEVPIEFQKGDSSNLKPEDAGKILSLYLAVHRRHNKAKLPEGWKRSATYKLTLLSHRDGSWQELLDAPSIGFDSPGAASAQTFDADCNAWGNPRFVALSKLNGPTKGFLHDDTLKIQARIAVFHDTQQAERIEQLQKYVESAHGDEATSDAEVRVGGASFLTHKFVLRQVPFFQTKFATEVGEDTSTSARVVATLPPEEVTADAFKVVLESLYKVDTPPTFPHGSELLEVHAAAVFLQMSVLQQACEAALGEGELSVEGLVPYLRYASVHKLADLKAKCFEFATDSGAQLGDFMLTEGFAEMVNEDRELYEESVQHLRAQQVQNSAGKKRKR